MLMRLGVILRCGELVVCQAPFLSLIAFMCVLLTLECLICNGATNGSIGGHLNAGVQDATRAYRSASAMRPAGARSAAHRCAARPCARSVAPRTTVHTRTLSFLLLFTF